MMHDVPRPAGCPSDFQIDRRLAGELGEEESGAIEAHCLSCARCGLRFRELSREKQSFERDAPELVLPGDQSRRVGRVRWIWGSGAGLLAAAAAIMIVARTGTETTRTKGHAASLGFYVNHGGGVRLGAAGERVEPGDALRFVVTTHEAGYLAVFSVDGGHHASLYFPDAATAVPVAPGDRVALPSSTVLDGTLGDETIYGVFCPVPFDVLPVLQALSAAPDQSPRPPDGCAVDTTHVHKEAPRVQ